MSETMIRPEARTLVLNSADNIAVALSNLDVGTKTPQGA
jgi:altronate hydrolase